MKSFDDFINNVDTEALFANTFNRIDKNVGLEEMVAKTSISFSIALLKAYHEWFTSDNN